MRHDGGADDANGKVERTGLLQSLQAGHKAHGNAKPVGLRHGQLDDKTARNRQHQPKHNGFNPAKTSALQAQHQQRVKGRNRNANRH